MSRVVWQRILVGMALTFMQTSLSQSPSKNAPLFEHDFKSSDSTLDIGSNFTTYLDSSGVLFLSDQMVLQYVLRSKQNNPAQGPERQAMESYALTLSLFDLAQKKAIATSDIAVPGRVLHLYRSRDGAIILATQTWIALVSPGLTIAQKVSIDTRLGNGFIRSAVDNDGSHIYLSGVSPDGCPQVVQVISSDSLLTQGWWCLGENQKSSFDGEMAAGYHASKDANVIVYKGGHQTTKLNLPGLLFISQAMLLSPDWLVASDGENILSYRLGQGVVFSSALIRKGNIASPLSCSPEGKDCAAVLAIPKSDFFDVAHETTYKDVALVAFSLADGSLRFRRSIHERFDGSKITSKSLSEAKVTISPSGRLVAVWCGSVWDVFSVP